MRRAVPPLVVAALLGGAAASAGALGTPLPLRAARTNCVPGSALFSASMPASAASARMAMRFDLERRRGLGDWQRLAVPRWGVWQRSAPRVPGFVLAKAIAGLSAPAYYRAVVRFRWYDAEGRVLRRARRTTLSCRQQDLRPDLVAGDVTQAPSGGYLVVVRNVGRGDAGPSSLTLTVDGVAAEVVLEGVRAGTERTVAVAARRCAPGSTVAVAVDATGAVDEAHEDDNLVVRPCPA